jgi:hypothetical protein
MSAMRVLEVLTLSPQERALLGKIVGRELRDGEVVGVQANPIIKPAPTGEAREKAARELKEAMDDLAAEVDPDATEEELDALLDEAREAARRGRR